MFMSDWEQPRFKARARVCMSGSGADRSVHHGLWQAGGQADEQTNRQAGTLERIHLLKNGKCFSMRSCILDIFSSAVATRDRCEARSL